MDKDLIEVIAMAAFAGATIAGAYRYSRSNPHTSSLVQQVTSKKEYGEEWKEYWLPVLISNLVGRRIDEEHNGDLGRTLEEVGIQVIAAEGDSVYLLHTNKIPDQFNPGGGALDAYLKKNPGQRKEIYERSLASLVKGILNRQMRVK